MKALALDAQQFAPADAVGHLLAHDIAIDGRTRLRKGHHITAEDIATLRANESGKLHLLVVEDGDIPEEEAAQRLVVAVAGAGVQIKGPVEGRYNVVAAARGLLRFDGNALQALNELDDISIFALYDGMTVEAGEVVAGVKVTPLIAREANVLAAEAIAVAAARGVIRVLPFRALPVGVVIKETLGERERERVIGRLRDKIAWFGGEVIAVTQVPDDAEAVGGAFATQLAAGAELLLATGGSALDPFDAMLGGLAQIGGRMERFGAPAHPGSLFWLAYTPDDVPIFGVASCGMFSKATAVDLLLPPIFAGEHLTKRQIAALWQGGLLNKEMGFKFPAYDAE
ncbi:MAG TPA: hypothetical protein VIL85_25625 [Thermomicrobiales bacterium]|jgi:hypothetical protein